MRMKFDFSGWATKNNLKCSDGKVIRHGAFTANNGKKVPLVWNHQHDDPTNVLGHAWLEDRDEGVYAYCSFNDTDVAQHAKNMIQHGDINALSIYANGIKQKGCDVVHGIIREVSLVLAGANPGAFIDSVMAHSEDGSESAYIFTGEELILEHGEITDEESEETTLVHAEDQKTEDKSASEKSDKEEKTENKDRTVKDVLDSMNEEQQMVLSAMIAEALASKNETEKKDESEGGKEEMKHNVFDNDQDTLQHSAEFEAAVIKDAKRCGSVRESFIEHSAEYGIDNIDWLFPEYQNVDGNGAPNFIKRKPDAWVGTVMAGVHHTPFSRIKMMFADLREDDARAKGYQKGKLKKEEVFGLLRRTVDPCTVYKKQKFDRDDVIDITDFDVISWVKGEMRMMLDEELAQAILFGDGRSSLSEDKISESNIIPIYKDASLYTIQKTVSAGAGEALGHALINAAVKAQDDYEGSGNLTCFISAGNVSDMLLLEDTQGHRMYKDMNELALAMGVERIVKVPASIIPTHVYAVIVDLKDYNVGADKGGAVNMFDDFDIDYNQQKYLIETRCSGALIKPYSAICLQDGSLS